MVHVSEVGETVIKSESIKGHGRGKGAWCRSVLRGSHLKEVQR